MGRLIDVDELINILGFKDTQEEREENVGEIITLNDIDRLPTACNPDKALEQLQKISDEAHDLIMVSDSPQYYDGYEDGVDKAIEIVKGGGVDG